MPYHRSMTLRLLAPVLAFAMALLAGAAQGQWPTKPARLIVAVPAGTAPDIIARMMTERLGKHIGQPVIVENVVGAGGLLATQALVRAAPDGYTFMFAGMGAYVLDPYMLKSPGYDPDRDLVPVAMIYEQERISITVHAGHAAKGLPDLIAMAKAKPGAMNYGITNVVLLEMVGRYINHLAGTQMVAVTYKTVGQQLQDLLGGRLDWVIAAPSQVESHMKAGKVRVIAMDGVGRSPRFPDIPLISETFPGYRISGMGIMVAPRGIPGPVVQQVNAAMERVNREPEYIAKLADINVSLSGAGTPESIAAFVADRRKYWAAIFKALNVAPAQN
jgi:tripartite-type tricarboxylate transporter receptor subunit TctC